MVRVVQTGPPALFAFPLPLLTYTSWQTEFGRWFKFGLRKHKCAFKYWAILPSLNESQCGFNGSAQHWLSSSTLRLFLNQLY